MRGEIQLNSCSEMQQSPSDKGVDLFCLAYQGNKL